MAGHTAEEIKRETRVYITVFAALAILTVATVAVSYLDLNFRLTVLVALVIASIKGFLVAGFFMHLLSEKKVIYSVLALTAFFFGFLLWIPFTEY